MTTLANDDFERIRAIDKAHPLQQEVHERPRKINCDQVVWVMNALERLQLTDDIHFVAISRLRETAKLSALLEIMEVLGYEFEDADAAQNALSAFREFRRKEVL